MKFLSRSLALVISMQLAVGCNGEVFTFKPGSLLETPLEEGQVEISGSIARSLIRLSEALLPTAHAAEGELNIYDITNPETPEIIHTEEISGRDNYAVRLKAELVAQKILKVEFVSKESDLKSRVLLVQPSTTEKTITAPLSESTSLKHKLVEDQLKREFTAGSIKAEEVHDRLKELKASDLDSAVNILGSPEYAAKLLLNSAISSDMAYLFNLFQSESNEDSKREILRKIYWIANDHKVFEDQVLLNCKGPFAALAIPTTDQTLDLYISGTDIQTLKTFGLNSHAYSFTEGNQANEYLRDIILKLIEFSKSSGYNAGLDIYIQDQEKKKLASCRVFGIEDNPDLAASAFEPDLGKFEAIDLSAFKSIDEARAVITKIYDESYKAFEIKLQESKLDPASSEYSSFRDYGITQIKMTFESKLREAEEYFSGK